MEGILLPWRTGPSTLQDGDSPSPLDLVGMAFAFTQSPLLSAREFIRGASERGVDIDDGQLQLLHRRRLLTPIFALHNRKVSEMRSFAFGENSWSDNWQLVGHARVGRLTDAADRPWPKQSNSSWPAPYLYSIYQYLALRMLGPLIVTMPKVRLSDGSWRPRLGKPSTAQIAECDRTRDLALLLEALSTRYRSRLFQVVHDPTDAMWSHLNVRDPTDERTLVSAPSERLVRQADHLLFQASRFDPLGGWHRVIRIGSPSRWRELRNDALLALDHRVAAELLLLYCEDLARRGQGPALAQPAGFHRPHGDRLKVDVRERGETVMDFDLSQRPRAVLALEGPTEMVFARALLDHYKTQEEIEVLRLVNLRSIKKDVRLLAHALVVPHIDPNGCVGARVLHPLTALVIAVDPEDEYATPNGCATKKEHMIEEVLQSVDPTVDATALRADLDVIVQVRTWPTGSFEFAHFTDRELAMAIRRLAKTSAPPIQELQASINERRDFRRNIEEVWKKWKVKPSKPDLAQQLVPTLIRKVGQGKSVPLVEALNEAIHLGQRMHGIREVAVRD